MRYVIRNLSGVDFYLAVVCFAVVKVADHRQRPFPDAAADIQMPVRFQRKLDIRMLDKALYIAMMVRSHGDLSERSVAVELERQQIILILKHVIHHDSRAHRASEGCGSERAGIVRFSGLLDQISAGYGKCADFVIRRDCPDHIILIFCHFLILHSKTFYTIQRMRGGRCAGLFLAGSRNPAPAP